MWQLLFDGRRIDMSRMQEWRLTLHRHEENFSGLRTSSERELYWGWQMMPTPEMVTKTIEYFLGLSFEPDERWMTVAEQIEDGLDCGSFSISLRRKDRTEEDFVSFSAGFMAV